MNTPANRMGTGGLALIGIGLGLVVAVLVDRQLGDGQTDRPVIAAAVTGVVAILWLAMVRLFIWPKAAQASVTKRNP
jgi:hypothetical protein